MKRILLAAAFAASCIVGYRAAYADQRCQSIAEAQDRFDLIMKVTVSIIDDVKIAQPTTSRVFAMTSAAAGAAINFHFAVEENDLATACGLIGDIQDTIAGMAVSPELGPPVANRHGEWLIPRSR